MRVLTALAASAALIVSSQAAAASITLDFGPGSLTTNPAPTGAAATVTMSFTDVVDGVEIMFEIFNATGTAASEGLASTSKLTGFTFDTISDMALVAGSVVFDVDGMGPDLTYLDTFLTDVSFAGVSDGALAAGTFDFAFADNGNFLGGNANAALPEGLTDFMSVTFASSLSAADLMAAYVAAFADGSAHAALRFMQVDGEGSDKLLFTPEVVPVPGAAVLMITALAAAGVARRRAAR